MNIAIDARSFLYTRTGIGYCITQILRQFLEHYSQHEYILYGVKYLGKNLITEFHIRGADILDDIRAVPFPFRKVSRYYRQMTSSYAIKKADIQLFWGPNYRGLFSKKFYTVITIHDMAHIHYPDYIEKHNYNFLTRELKKHAMRSTLILVPSISTKSDIVNYLGIPEDKVKVIYWGVEPLCRPIQDTSVLDSTRERYGLSQNNILFVGTLQPRKNVEGLIEAFRILNIRSQIPHNLLLVGCKGWEYSEVFRRINEYGLNDKVKWIGYVDSKDLPVLYNIADAFVLPSHYEGFGLPILEAMACGTPVITSNVSSMPEVAGDAAILIDPKSPEMIADGIEKVINDRDLKDGLRERGLIRAKEFTWGKSAAETIASFEEVTS